MSPTAPEPQRDQQPGPALRTSADPERKESALTGQPGQLPQARLQHLFRHAGDAPDNRFLRDLVTRHFKLPAA
jgi:hypothetical protein